MTTRTQRERMGFVERTLAGDRSSDGRIQKFSNFLQLRPGLAVVNALAGVDHRFVGGSEFTRGGLHMIGIGRSARFEHRLVAADVGGFVADVPRNFHQYRAGAAIAQLGEGAPHHIHHFGAAGQRFGPLGDVLHVQGGIEVGVVVGDVAGITGRHEQHRH